MNAAVLRDPDFRLDRLRQLRAQRAHAVGSGGCPGPSHAWVHAMPARDERLPAFVKGSAASLREDEVSVVRAYNLEQAR